MDRSRVGRGGRDKLGHRPLGIEFLGLEIELVQLDRGKDVVPGLPELVERDADADLGHGEDVGKVVYQVLLEEVFVRDGVVLHNRVHQVKAGKLLVSRGLRDGYRKTRMSKKNTDKDK